MALMRLLLSRCSRPWRLHCVCLCSCAVDIQHTMITILRRGGGRGSVFRCLAMLQNICRFLDLILNSGGHVQLDQKSPWSV